MVKRELFCQLCVWHDPTSTATHSFTAKDRTTYLLCERHSALIDTAGGELVKLTENDRAYLLTLPSPYRSTKP